METVDIANLLKKVLSAPALNKEDGKVAVNMLEQFKKNHKLSEAQVKFLNVILKRSSGAEGEFAEKFKNSAEMQEMFEKSCTYYQNSGYFRNTIAKWLAAKINNIQFVPDATSYEQMVNNKYFQSYYERMSKAPAIGTIVKLTNKNLDHVVDFGSIDRINYNKRTWPYSPVEESRKIALNAFIVVKHSQNEAKLDIMCLITKETISVFLADISKKPV
jgi:sulfur relay (sulfurtransferase) DsrC/TusE family protein